MHYDVFSKGFSYYSDHSGISYSTLNAMAIKYVLLFRCRDFFLDETINTSPLIDFAIKERVCLKNKKRSNIFKVDDEINSPFVNLKHNSPVGGNLAHLYANTKSVRTDRIFSSEIQFIQNKFVNLGKLHNCDFLQKVKLPEFKKTNNYIDYKQKLIVTTEEIIYHPSRL